MKCISQPHFIFLFGALFYVLDTMFYDQKQFEFEVFYYVAFPSYFIPSVF
jgi:hypothetical protein